MVDWIRVNSNAISQVAYSNGILYIVFRESSECYQYSGVPASVYTGLVTARSIGQYFNQWIRDNYPEQQLSYVP